MSEKYARVQNEYCIYILSAFTHLRTYSLSISRSDPPLITLEFGTNPVVEGNVVSEGADVYFECNIKANPWVYRVAWRHNVS